MNILTAAVSAVIPHLPEAISATWDHFTKEEDSETEKAVEPAIKFYGRTVECPKPPQIKDNASPKEIKEAHYEYMLDIYNQSHRDMPQRELVELVNKNLKTNYSYSKCWRIWHEKKD